MKFSTGSVRDIKSISQRSLACYWAQLGALPSIEEFQPGSRLHDPKQIAVWAVERSDEQTVFRGLSRGSLLDEAFKEAWIGRSLAEVTPPSLRKTIIGASSECAKTGCAIYTIVRTYDDTGCAIDLERLLLPFGQDGCVDQIVASLQLISLAGSFKRKTVLASFEAESTCVFAIKIPALSEALPAE